MRLAIVGSQCLEGSVQARLLVRAALRKYNPNVVVSGGARGVDTIAEEEANVRGLETRIYLPTAAGWPGYRARNLEIAHDCDRLIRIASTRSNSYGSGWTRDRAAELGVPTEEYIIDEETGKTMAAGNRPTHKLVAKNKETGAYTDLLAFWKNERFPGFMNGSCDKNSGARIRAKNRDGKEETITSETHYISFEPITRGGQRGADAGDDDAEDPDF